MRMRVMKRAWLKYGRRLVVMMASSGRERKRQNSPTPAKKPRTRQLTLKETMGETSGSSGACREQSSSVLSDTPPLFSDSESDQACIQEDSLSQSEDLNIPTSATLPYTSSSSIGTPPPSPRGVPLNEISFGPSCDPILPPLSSSPSHTVTFHPRLQPATPPRPYPDKFCDIWDSNHVRSPCSSQSLYPIKTTGGDSTLMSRWALIRASLSKPIANSYDLEEAIMEYNSRQKGKWFFGGLHAYFSEVAAEEEMSAFFSSLLPKLINLALKYPQLVTHGLPLLRKQERYSLSISQQQVACLLANAFLCTFPRRNASHKGAEFANYPSINFNTLYAGKRVSIHPVRAAKLKCIFHYFTRVTSSIPTGVLTFTRQVSGGDPPQWDKMEKKLTKLHVVSEGTIEDDGHGMLQVDFANRQVGGGVLSSGAVQEEIRFLICPELIVSRLFTEELDDNESLIITGAEQFSTYSGYGSSFEWAGSHVDGTTRDSWTRRETSIVAMDALVIRNSASQFKPGLIRREVNKAFCSFLSSETTPCGRPTAVATGNWGCGAFGGDKRLKALLQWLAASAADRDIVYFTFGDRGLQQDLHILQKELQSVEARISDIWRYLMTYHRERNPPPLYQFILENLKK